MLALGDADRTDAVPAAGRAAAPRAVRHRTGRRVRLGVLHGASTARRRPATVRRDRRTRSRTSTCASPSTRATARTRSTTSDGLRLAGLGRLVDGGDGGDTYNYSPPDDRRHRRPARCGADRRRSSPGPVRARSRVESDYTWPACAIGDEQSCSARSDDDRIAVTVATTLELRPDERFLRVTHELRQPGARPPARARTSRCPRRVDGLRRRVRVHRGAPRPHRRRRHARVRAADVPVAALRRRVRRRRRLRAAPRRPARVRGRRRRPRARAHTAARDRLPVALGAVAAAEPRGPDRSRCTGAQMLGEQRVQYAVLPPPRRLARGRLLRRGRRVPRPVRTRARRRARRRAARVRTRAARRRRRGLGRDRACRRPGRARVPHRARRGTGRRSSTTARPPAAGSSTSRAGRSRRSKATSSCARGRSAPCSSRDRARSRHGRWGSGGAVGTPRPGRRTPTSVRRPAGTNAYAAAHAAEPVVQRGVGEHGARIGRATSRAARFTVGPWKSPWRTIDVTERDADPQLGQARGRTGVDELERERARDAGRVRDEHHRVADALHDVRTRRPRRHRRSSPRTGRA